MDDLSQAFADRLEPDLSQFEANAALWRLDAHRHVSKLTEEQSIGIRNPAARESAEVALEEICFEIDRLQAFSRRFDGLRQGLLLRLVEPAPELKSARRRLKGALAELAMTDSAEDL